MIEWQDKGYWITYITLTSYHWFNIIHEIMVTYMVYVLSGKLTVCYWSHGRTWRLITLKDGDSPQNLCWLTNTGSSVVHSELNPAEPSLFLTATATAMETCHSHGDTWSDRPVATRNWRNLPGNWESELRNWRASSFFRPTTTNAGKVHAM